MKKVIVFRVENVLVKDYDEMGMWELRMKKWVRKMVKKEFGVDLSEEKSLDGMKKRIEELEKMYGETGDVVMMLTFRNVGKRIREVEEGKERMVGEMRKKFIDDGFERKKIVMREELIDLERVGKVVEGMRLVFVSGLGKMIVFKLLMNNGLKGFEVVENLDELGEVEKSDVVVFGNEKDVEKVNEMGMKGVLGTKDMWKEIGLKKMG